VTEVEEGRVLGHLPPRRLQERIASLQLDECN